MKVLMISKALVVGAYQRKAEELAKFPDVELMVVAPPSWLQEGKPIPLDRRYTSGYRLVAEPIALNGHFHVHWYPLLSRRFREFRPDLVHIDEEAYNLSALQAQWLSRRVGARSVYFTWQNIDRRFPWPFSAFERYTLEHASYCIAGNQEAAEIQLRHGFKGGVRVIPQFGIDPELFRRLDVPKPPGFTIGFAGRLVEQKGLWPLCDAFERLPDDCRLLLVGSGPLEQPLRERAARNGWQSRLRIEAAASTKMPELYCQMDCLVLPSLTTPSWKEQFGRAAIEAMACEVPVIGSDSGEIPHLLGDAGVVVAEGDADALAAATLRLCQHPEERATLASAGRNRATARFTQASVAEQTYDVYRRVLENVI